VRDNIDTLDQFSPDRIMQKISGCCAPRSHVTSTTVLVITGIPASAVSDGLAHAAALGPPKGIALNVFGSIAYLPPYSETVDIQRLVSGHVIPQV